MFRAPLGVTEIVLDVSLGDIGVRRTWCPNWVRINLRRANPAGWRLSSVRQEDAGARQKDTELDSDFYLAASVESDKRIADGRPWRQRAGSSLPNFS